VPVPTRLPVLLAVSVPFPVDVTTVPVLIPVPAAVVGIPVPVPIPVLVPAAGSRTRCTCGCSPGAGGDRPVHRRVAGNIREPRVDLIISTGGTGLSPRDQIPEAVRDVVERLTPGFDEARLASLGSTKLAMLSRACSGIRGSTFCPCCPMVWQNCRSTVRSTEARCPKHGA
jgi:hypothetical protein